MPFCERATMKPVLDGSLLFITTWPINDPLTVASALPGLKVLAESGSYRKIYLLTREATGKIPLPSLPSNVSVIYAGLSQNGLRRSPAYALLDLIFKGFLISARSEVKVLVARGTPAGGAAAVISLLTRVPFYVESYEPHSDYMAESGTWSRLGPKYLLTKFFEWLVLKRARGVFVLTHAYKRLLDSRKTSVGLEVLPCTVDLERFACQPSLRQSVRKAYGFQSGDIVGVYAGKFGGLYLKAEVWEIFSECFQQIPGFRLLLLTSVSEVELRQVLDRLNPAVMARVSVNHVDHDEMPGQLAAADFGFVLVNPGPTKLASSSIKLGEYWASGLPLVVTPGVGDDSDTISQTGLGAVWDLSPGSAASCARTIKRLLETDPEHRLKVQDLARRSRAPEQLLTAYRRAGLV